MIPVWSRRCVMFTLLLAMCAAGALGPAQAEAAVPRPSQMASSPNGIAMAGVQRCSGAIDATGTAGAGIGRLIDVGHGIYDFVLQLNPELLAQFSPELMSFGYQVTYSVNGHMAKGVFAGGPQIPSRKRAHPLEAADSRAPLHSGRNEEEEGRDPHRRHPATEDRRLSGRSGSGPCVSCPRDDHLSGVTCQTNGGFPLGKNPRMLSSFSRKLGASSARICVRRSPMPR